MEYLFDVEPKSKAEKLVSNQDIIVQIEDVMEKFTNVETALKDIIINIKEFM